MINAIKTWFADFIHDIHRVFIVDARWTWILEGLLNTLIITAGALVIGIVIGIGVGIVIGIILGVLLRKKIAEKQIGSAEEEVKRIREEGEKQAETLKKEFNIDITELR